MSIINDKSYQPIVIKEFGKKRREEVMKTFKTDNALVEEVIGNIPAKAIRNLPKQNLEASFKKLISKINKSLKIEPKTGV